MSWGMGQWFFNKRFVASERNFISEFVNYSSCMMIYDTCCIDSCFDFHWFELCVGKLTVDGFGWCIGGLLKYAEIGRPWG